MAKKENRIIDDEPEAPDWFISLLNSARASRSFQERCRQAGALALDIDRLRSANRARAPERIALAARVRKLARAAKVSLEPVLDWFGIKEMTLADGDANLAHFGHDLGFRKEYLMESIYAGEAAMRGMAVPQAARGKRKKLEDLPWDTTTVERFRSLREAINAVYESTESEE